MVQLVDVPPDVLRHIIRKLTLRDLSRLRAVSRYFCATITQDLHLHLPRIVVSSSANRLVVEINPDDGTVVSTAPVRGQAKRKRTVRGNRAYRSWHTGMAFSPYDGDLYICQYAVSGVVVLHGESLKYRKQFVSRTALATPEGIAFARQHLYVCSAFNGTVAQVTLTGMVRNVLTLSWPSDLMYMDDGALRSDPVPWGMTVGPDEHLYIAVDCSYEADSYDQVPTTTTGNVIRVFLNDNGSFTGEQECVCEEGRLKRPSGLCFDDVGDIYVTSLTDEVLVFVGPGKEFSGRLLRVAVRSGDGELSHPWDVRWFRGKLAVTTHTDRQRGNLSGVNVYNALTGTRFPGGAAAGPSEDWLWKNVEHSSLFL
eukprot:jgi/Botrbrau1/6346/Bobra.0098s0005.1